MTARHLSWFGIFRLGLVQAALGSIVVLTTSTLNRIMVVELNLAAVIPGALVGIHYGVQIARPLWGHGSDRGGRRTPWIVGGIALLALAGTGAATATALMAESFAIGLALAIVDFVLIGFGVGAAGTSLLALLAASVAPERRPAAATMVWLMMIFGIAVTAVVTGHMLDPFSMMRLIAVTACTGVAALALTALAVFRIERSIGTVEASPAQPVASFRDSLTDAWRDPQARLFTIFVLVSMLGYSMQDLVLEPFAGLAFGMTPGATTKLSGMQNGGVFAGMLLVGIGGSLLARRYPSLLKFTTVAGCLLSALALCGLVTAAAFAPAWPLTANVLALGFANGIFAVAAIASMMALAGASGKAKVGLRMGLWGGAQAVGFGFGGFAGTVVAGLIQKAGASVSVAYGSVFALEAAIFVAAALIALRISPVASTETKPVRPRARVYGASLQPAE